MDGTCSRSDQRGPARAEDQEGVQRRGSQDEVDPGRQQTSRLPPVEAVGPAEAAQGRHRCPRSSGPLADRASYRRADQPHCRQAADPENEHGIQYEVYDVHADGDPKRRAHVVSTAQRTERSQAHEHRWESDEAVSQVIHSKRGHGSAGTHRSGGLAGEQCAGNRNNRAGDQSDGHRYQAHAGGALIDDPLAAQGGDIRLRGNAEKAEGPGHR